MAGIKISIIVPVFNSGEYLKTCIDSLLVQTLENIEIVLVDDGSTDNSPATIDRYAEKDMRIKVMHQLNSGLSVARNTGMTVAGGEYILFVDSDDWLSIDACHALYTYAHQRDTDVLLTTMLYSEGNGKTYRVGDKAALFHGEEVMDGKDCLAETIKTGTYTPMVCGNLYRKRFLEEHHLLFQGRIHEDERFMPYALYYANHVAYMSGDFYFYRQHASSLVHSGRYLEQMQSLADIGGEFCKFVTGRIEGDENHLSVYHSLLCLVYRLYICSLQLYKQVLNSPMQVVAPVLDTEVMSRYRSLFSAEEQDLLKEKETALQELRNHVLFVEKCGTEKKQLFIFSYRNIRGKCGTEDYVTRLKSEVDLSQWDVSVVILYSRRTSYAVEVREGISYLFLPCSASVTKTVKLQKRYMKSVFCLLANQVRYRQVYYYSGSSSFHELVMFFREKLNGQDMLTLYC